MTSGTNEENGEASTNTGRHRLEGAITAVRADFESLVHETGAGDQSKWWVTEVRELLDTADEALKTDKIEQGWYHLHAAERRQVYGLEELEDAPEALAGKARELRVEAKNSNLSWRATAAQERLTKDNGTVTGRDIRSAYALLHEGYQRVHLKRQHLQSQVKSLRYATLGAIVLILLFSGISTDVNQIPSPFFEFANDENPTEPVGFLVYIALFGMLGAALFGLWSLTTRQTSASAPQYLSGREVTMVRLLIGASSALAIFFFLRSGLIEINMGAGLNNGPFLIAIAFVSGYSERLVHATVESVAGSGEADLSEKE